MYVVGAGAGRGDEGRGREGGAGRVREKVNEENELDEERGEKMRK